MENFIIPDEIKDSVFSGTLSDQIEEALNMYDFSVLPQFNDYTEKDIVDNFKAYICYLIMNQSGELEAYVFFKFLETVGFEMFKDTFIDDFIKIVVSSQFTDEFLINYAIDSKSQYQSLLRNCMCDQYKKLSKSLDPSYKKQVSKYVIANNIHIDPKVLVTLTKCAIIESKRKPSLEYEFTKDTDAIEYAYYLYEDQSISFDERKSEVEYSKRIMEDLDNILGSNGYSR